LPGNPPHAGDTVALDADGSEVEDARNGGVVAPRGATDPGRRPALPCDTVVPTLGDPEAEPVRPVRPGREDEEGQGARRNDPWQRR